MRCRPVRLRTGCANFFAKSFSVPGAHAASPCEDNHAPLTPMLHCDSAPLESEILLKAVPEMTAKNAGTPPPVCASSDHSPLPVCVTMPSSDPEKERAAFGEWLAKHSAMLPQRTANLINDGFNLPIPNSKEKPPRYDFSGSERTLLLRAAEQIMGDAVKAVIEKFETGSFDWRAYGNAELDLRLRRVIADYLRAKKRTHILPVSDHVENPRGEDTRDDFIASKGGAEKSAWPAEGLSEAEIIEVIELFEYPADFAFLLVHCEHLSLRQTAEAMGYPSHAYLNYELRDAKVKLAKMLGLKLPPKNKTKNP